MTRLRLMPPLVCLLCLLLSNTASTQEVRPSAEAPAAQPSRLAALARHFCYLRVLSEPPLADHASEMPAICCGEEELPTARPVRLPTFLDTNALALKLAPRELKRHGIGFQLSEIFPLGHQGRQGRRPYGAADHFLFAQRLARSCLMDDRPDGQGFEFSLGYPVQETTRVMLGVQAEEGGRLGRSDLRSLLGISFGF